MTPEQHNALMSSATAEWGTPRWLFAALSRIEREHPYTLDVCATAENARCKQFYTKQDNCFVQSWTGHWWCNPVYGNAKNVCATDCAKVHQHVHTYEPGILDFVDYGIGQMKLHHSLGMFLVPARTDTEWFGKLWRVAYSVTFIHGRLHFEQNGIAGRPAPFPSVLMEISPRVLLGGPSVGLVSQAEIKSWH